MADNKPSTAEAVDGAAPRLLEEAQREAAVSDVAQVFTLATPPFKITHVNNKWVQLCGFLAEEAVGRTCSLIQRPETTAGRVMCLLTARPWPWPRDPRGSDRTDVPGPAQRPALRRFLRRIAASILSHQCSSASRTSELLMSLPYAQLAAPARPRAL